MKKLILSSVLALVAAAAATSSASAQVVLNSGDLILSFRITSGSGTGATTNLEVDLGAATNFEGLAPGTVLSLNSGSGSNPGLNVADLVATYGANWATRADLSFGVTGATTNLNTGANSVWIGTPNGTNKPNNAFDLSTLEGQAVGIYSNLTGTGNSSTTGTAPADPNSSGNYTGTVRPTGATTDYNFFNYTTENSVQKGSPAKLELFSMVEGNTNKSKDDGYFLLSSNGTLTFNVAGAAVPEPSAYALGICAVLLFLVLKRRQSVA